MLRFIKSVFLFVLLALLSQTVQAQVKFKLSLLPDQRTYVVSLLAETSWSTPMNRVGSAQIVLRMQSGSPFLAGEIKSLLPGVSWTDNTYVSSPASAKEFDFVCFVLNEMGTKAIPFEAGVETPLFTFVNTAPGCVGTLELVDNDSPYVKAIATKDKLNLTQNITVLGARGNAYMGIVGDKTDCSAVTGASENVILSQLRIFPVPATQLLRISWESSGSAAIDQLLVMDITGRQIAMKSKKEFTGDNQINLDVSTFPTGLYTGSLINAEGAKQAFQFVVEHF